VPVQKISGIAEPDGASRLVIYWSISAGAFGWHIREWETSNPPRWSPGTSALVITPVFIQRIESLLTGGPCGFRLLSSGIAPLVRYQYSSIRNFGNSFQIRNGQKFTFATVHKDNITPVETSALRIFLILNPAIEKYKIRDDHHSQMAMDGNVAVQKERAMVRSGPVALFFFLEQFWTDTAPEIS